MKEIYNTNPNALMFGTDLPSIRASRHFSTQDIKIIENTFDEETCHKIFYKNALNWYQK
jgi:predicted TIM-barrel fold metal-dependent hydrolase